MELPANHYSLSNCDYAVTLTEKIPSHKWISSAETSQVSPRSGYQIGNI